VFNRVLIANRGEIAIRIARAASALGMESVAVFAPADALSLHTRFATEAHGIGAGISPRRPIRCAPISTSTRSSRRPRAAAATACTRATASCPRTPPSRSAARRRACASSARRPALGAVRRQGEGAHVRAARSRFRWCPGSDDAAAFRCDATALAQALGYPVMLKAAAGGGGRGMRAVEPAEDLAEAFARCQGEARAAFGDGALFLEKLVVRPRHIEVQVLGDAHGNVVHLFERDCSVQLRNQKVVEIAPAPNLDDACARASWPMR
jgi:pyruvate carboxylase subunit A